MNFHDLNPFIRFCRAVYALEPRYEDSICYDSRLFYIKRGLGSISLEEKSFSLSPGSAVFLPAGTRYRFNFEKWDGLCIFIFNFDLTASHPHIDKTLGTASPESYNEEITIYDIIPGFDAPLYLHQADMVELTLWQCTVEFINKPDFYKEHTSALLKESLITLFRSARNFTPASRISDEVMQYIYENFHDPELSNESIAAALGYHPYHLSRLMRETTGQTLHRKITAYRIAMAKNFLITTRLDIGEIAWRCGINSVSYFVELFHREVGLTPAKYRKAKQIMEI